MTTSAKASVTVERERALIGRLIFNPKDRYSLTLKPSDFCDVDSCTVYDALARLMEAGVDYPTVEDLADKTGKDEGAILDLTMNAHTGPLDGLERVIREASIDRKVRNMCRRIIHSDLSGSKLLDAAQTAFNCIDSGFTGQGKPLGELVAHVYEEWEAAKMGKIQTHVTGVSAIDNQQLLERGGISIIAGRPSMGKSTFTAYLLKQLAENGDKCLLIPTEMSNRRTAKRYLASQARINSRDITAGRNLHQTATARLEGGVHALQDLPIWIDDSVHRAGPIARSIREHRQRHGVNVIALDHVQRAIDGVDPQRELFELLNTVTAVAAESPRCTVILVSQLNRLLEKRQDKHPMLSDLRESGKLEEDADSVMFCYRPAYYEPEADKYSLEIGVAKNRDGEQNVIEMEWEYSSGQIVGPR